jgi:hypothetical protein
MARTDQDLINDLLASPPAIQTTPRPHPIADEPEKRTKPRRSHSLYNLIIGKAAICVGLIVTAIGWWYGAHYTLIGLESWGLRLTSWGIVAWLIPVGISAIEVGTIELRANNPPLWVLWFGITAIDAFTTAVGILDGHVLFGKPILADDIGWSIAIAIGIALAFTPEWFAKGLFKDLFK